MRKVLALLSAREATAAAAAGVAPPDAPVWLRSLLPSVRAMDWTRRAKYRTIQATLALLHATAV